MSSIAPIILGVLCLFLSVVITWAMRELARRRHLLDHPNERSAHTAPTPRLGGVGIVVPFFCASIVVGFVIEDGHSLVSSAVLAGTLSMALLGLADDIRSIRARWRFLAQVGTASMVVAVVGADIQSALGIVGRILPLPLAYLFAVLWIVWVTNLYNFMDGIDGIAGGQTLIACSAIGFVALAGGNSFVGWSAIFLAASALGFLVFNFPPASIFMGDVGATAIGFFLACISFIRGEGAVPFEVVAIATSLFLLDATVTLIRRMLRSEKWYQAHRSHYYQRPLALGVGHRPITLAAYAGMTVVAVSAVFYSVTNGMPRVAFMLVPLLTFLFFVIVVFRMEKCHRPLSHTHGRRTETPES